MMSGRPDHAIAQAISFHGTSADALFRLRDLIFETAAENPEIGELLESLKWGQPSYTPKKANIGSSVRLGLNKSGNPALFFICHTNIVDRFRELYPDTLCFEGKRAVILDANAVWPIEELKHCVAIALTWKMEKRRKM